MEKLAPSDAHWLRGRASGWQRSFANRKILRTLAGSFIFIVTLKLLWSLSLQSHLPVSSPNDFYLQRGLFEPLQLGGFVNTGNPGKIKCDQLRHEGQIQVQQSFHLDDDLQQVAAELKDHPMIIYDGQDPKLSHAQIVDKTWARLSGSSVWLEKYQVYLAVTRVIFFDKGVKHWPIVSFIRGQIYNEHWVEQKNYTITWQGEEIKFPKVFDIPTPYEAGGGFYGPEDPRIIIEEGVEDAEPVVVFNMLSDIKTAVRTMHVFRPFSNATTIMTINGQKERAVAEKNWAPFFYNPEQTTSGGQKWPSKYIHFLHTFKPLKILRCQLLNGYCDLVYEQDIPGDIPDDFAQSHNDTKGRMSGGTNLVRLPMDSAPGTMAFVGFPRTHIGIGCTKEAMYRPELMVMTASSESHFHIDYLSDSIDFASAILSPEAIADPCGEGRILIANSVSRWDRSARQDVMTIAVTVDDSTVQAVRVHGIWNYLKQLPYLQYSLKHDVRAGGDALWDLRWSAVGTDVLACTVEAAQNHSIALAAPYNGTDLREAAKHAREEAARKKKEAEEKQIKEEEEKRRKEEEEKKKIEEEARKNAESVRTKLSHSPTTSPPERREQQ